MKKKMRHLYRFLLICGCLTIGVQSLGAQVDDLFKGFDFDAFLKDMEKAYDEEADQKAFGAKPAPSAGVERTVTTQAPSKKPQTKEELFLTPITQTIQEKGKPAQTKLTPESLKAFKEIMHEFVTLLHEVELKVDGSSIFSLPFKEQFAQFHEAIDKTTVAYGTLISKKKYATIVPFNQPPEAKDKKTGAKPSYGSDWGEPKAAQPKEGANIRKNIIDAIKELRALDKELTTAIATEEKEAKEEIEALQELATKQRGNVTFEESPLTTKSKRKSVKGSAKPVKSTSQKAKKKHKDNTSFSGVAIEAN